MIKKILFIIWITAAVSWSFEVRVINGTSNEIVPKQKVSVRVFDSGKVIYEGNKYTDIKGLLTLKLSNTSASSNISLSTIYDGNNFTLRDILRRKNVLNVYEAANVADNISIEQMHIIVTVLKDSVRFDYRLNVLNSSKYYHVNEDAGFSLPIQAGLLLEKSSPKAKLGNSAILFENGLRPGDNWISFTVSKKGSLNSLYKLKIFAGYSIHNLLIIGHPGYDLVSQVKNTRQIKRITDNNYLTYLKIDEIRADKDVSVTVIPLIKSAYNYLKEILSGVVLGIIFLFVKKFKKGPVDSFDNMVESLKIKDRYDREI